MIDEVFLVLALLSNVLMIALAIVAGRSRDLMMAAVLVAGVSLIASFLFVLMRAPDVAMAEASVGSALTAIILIYAIRKTDRFESSTREGGDKE